MGGKQCGRPYSWGPFKCSLDSPKRLTNSPWRKAEPQDESRTPNDNDKRLPVKELAQVQAVQQPKAQ